MHLVLSLIFYFIAVQGHKKCLNAIFSNIKMVMHGRPEDFHFRHLKRAVLVNMIEKRKEFMDDSCIVKHLNKSQYSYKDAVLEIKNRDADEPIPQYLGDFIVAAISKTIGRTIVVIKPKIEMTTDVNNRALVKYLCYTEYLFGEDKGAGKGCDLIMLVWNGLDYFANAIPKHIINLTRSASNALNFVAEATEQINDIIDSVPPSETRTTLSKALRAMGAAERLPGRDTPRNRHNSRGRTSQRGYGCEACSGGDGGQILSQTLFCRAATRTT